MAQPILSVIKKALENHEPEVLVFADLDREVASQILDNLGDPEYDLDESGCRLHYSARDGYLRLVMQTQLHECPISWMAAECMVWLAHGRLRLADYLQLRVWKPTCDSFMGRYAGSKKTPDLALTPCIDGRPKDYPSVVFESGLSESEIRLMRDSQLWLEGTAGAVRVVILCKTFAPDGDNKIRASLWIHRIMPNGSIDMKHFPIFPVPEEDTPDPYITVDELFSGTTPTGLAATSQLPLSMQRLRDALRMEIQLRRGLTA